MNPICPKKSSTRFFRWLEKILPPRLESERHCVKAHRPSSQTTSKAFPKLCIAALFVSVLSILGIQSSYGADAQKPVVGLVMKSLANEFFKDMQEGAIKHAAQRGDLVLLPVGMHSETDIDTQVNAVETFITKKVDAIVIAPADSRALVAPLARAIKAGIVVINIDVALDEQAKKQAGISLAFVGPDNRAGAKLAGDELAKALGKGGKVVIIEGNPGADNAQQRKLGFEDAIKAGKLQLIDSRTAHWETEEANSVFSNMLTAHPEIQGVMAANDSMALGVIKAIDAAGKSGKIKVVGFDNIPAVQPLLKEKKLLATVDQFGSQMAANGIDYALKARAGEKLQGWIKTPIKLVKAPGS
jgi:ribose transport system substrate-binding protein